jgi:tetratricopeptide (TPR) repeat protein
MMPHLCEQIVEAGGRALALGPSGDGYYALALAQYGSGTEPLAALETLDMAIALTDNPMDGFQRQFKKGDWLMAQGCTAEALRAYEYATRWGYPLSPYWHFAHGRALLAAGRGEQAKAELRGAPTVSPTRGTASWLARAIRRS